MIYFAIKKPFPPHFQRIILRWKFRLMKDKLEKRPTHLLFMNVA
jgi:hypothetical protein